MASLSDQINKLSDEIKKLQDTVSDNESSLNSKKNAFLKASQEAKDEITNQLNKIHQYIS